MLSSWLCKSIGSLNSLMGHTESCNTSTISDLGLFVVIRRFLAIPVLLGMFSRYCACVTRAVPLLLIALALFCFLLQ